jgi:hypothetical protein
MVWLITTLALLSQGTSGSEVLPSRELLLPPAVVQAIDPVSFDLIDFRNEQWLGDTKSRKDEDPHTIFVIKRHIGASMGYDNTIVHGSVGLYLTVAEWGRWNFGVPSVGVGAGRYPIYDRTQNRSVMSSQATVFISIASIHYRLGYLRSVGANWYLNLEQVYDLRYNLAGSQFGVSFSSK